MVGLNSSAMMDQMSGCHEDELMTPNPSRPITQAPSTHPHLRVSSEPELQPLVFIDRRSASAHRFLVSCVCWYPIDTGLFVTGMIASILSHED
jgi:hypothetical protein